MLKSLAVSAPGLRVPPKATSRACFRGRCRMRSKKALSFSLLPGKPPST